MIKMIRACSALIYCSVIIACSDSDSVAANTTNVKETVEAPLLIGKWIKESDGSIMLDPQTSGLSYWRGSLLSLSDGSAHESQQRRLHIMNMNTAQLAPKTQEMTMSSRVRRSCFSQYLRDQPDLEALVVNHADDSIGYIVTEDATRTGALSVKCQQRFSPTGSTDYPTLLLRIKIADNGEATITHVRPLRFSMQDEVGDFPNDGIEGLAITADNTLFLGLEKDKAGNARIFQLTLTSTFWTETGFADVKDSQLLMPTFNAGNHPINGLTWHQAQPNHPGYIIAAARNDNEIWVLDLKKEKATLRVPLTFAAQIEGNTASCSNHEVMDNASIEGLAIANNTLWLVNDPWKRNYLKNIQCENNADYYQAMAPLLFSMPLAPEWFE